MLRKLIVGAVLTASVLLIRADNAQAWCQVDQYLHSTYGKGRCSARPCQSCINAGCSSAACLDATCSAPDGSNYASIRFWDPWSCSACSAHVANPGGTSHCSEIEQNSHALYGPRYMTSAHHWKAGNYVDDDHNGEVDCDDFTVGTCVAPAYSGTCGEC
jgi:hypothetical protein